MALNLLTPLIHTEQGVFLSWDAWALHMGLSRETNVHPIVNNFNNGLLNMKFPTPTTEQIMSTEQSTHSWGDRTWPLHRKRVIVLVDGKSQTIDQLSHSPEDEAEYIRLQDKEAFDEMMEMKRLGTLPKELQDYFKI